MRGFVASSIGRHAKKCSDLWKKATKRTRREEKSRRICHPVAHITRIYKVGMALRYQKDSDILQTATR